jgi:hypothetical protein
LVELSSGRVLVGQGTEESELALLDTGVEPFLARLVEVKQTTPKASGRPPVERYIGERDGQAFFSWDSADEGKTCVLKNIPEFNTRLGVGTPLSAIWPADAQLAMNDDHPRDNALADNLGGFIEVPVVSERLAAMLPRSDVELLPVVLLDMNKKPVAERYFLVNPLAALDCIDKTKTELTYYDSMPDDIQYMENLTLDPARVPDAVQVFQLKGMQRTIIRAALAERLVEAGLTGVRWKTLDNVTR